MNASRRHTLIAAALVLLLVGSIGLIALVHAQRAKLELGVGYGARVACGCRYIEGRPLSSCYKDFEPGMAVIRLSDDPRTRTVTAWVPLLVSRAVRFEPALGCQPEPLRPNHR
jgi:hypothetical protein